MECLVLGLGEFLVFYSMIFYLLADVTGFLSKNIPAINKIGNMTAARIPFFRSSEAILEIYPTSEGPPEHPRSPASASKANMAVPPFLIAADALLKLPGHIIPTDNPQIPHHIRERTGEGESEIHR